MLLIVDDPEAMLRRAVSPGATQVPPVITRQLYRACLSMEIMGGQAPAWASPVTTNPKRW
jgi:hypothetical protein